MCKYPHIYARTITYILWSPTNFKSNLSLSMWKITAKKVRNFHYCHVIIFYLPYADHLTKNIIWIIKIMIYHAIKKLFLILSFIIIYEMNFFSLKLMPWEAFIPKFYVIFIFCAKKFQPGNLLRLEKFNMAENYSKNMKIFNTNSSHSFKFQWKKFIL